MNPSIQTGILTRAANMTDTERVTAGAETQDIRVNNIVRDYTAASMALSQNAKGELMAIDKATDRTETPTFMQRNTKYFIAFGVLLACALIGFTAYKLYKK